LFRRDPRWRGSDDAYSIPLGDERFLWMFGDTFVAREPGDSRKTCAFIRNSIGIQQGKDPSTAAISFHWSAEGSQPADFFRSEGGWLWPLHGTLLDERLLLFFMRVRSPEAGRSGAIQEWMESDSLSFFEVYGWAAFAVSNPGAPPEDWNKEELDTPTNEFGVVLGAGVLLEEDRLYAWGWTQERDGFLARWRAEDAKAGELRKIEWWAGDGRWEAHPDPGGVALPQAQTEFTVHRDPQTGLLFQTQAMGLSPSDLTIRSAPQPEGPWTEPQAFFRIPESERPGVIGYAGKAHPHLEGADLAFTYASNGDTAEITLGDESIYYPRFVRAGLEA
jgi:hypothetical protein